MSALAPVLGSLHVLGATTTHVGVGAAGLFAVATAIVIVGAVGVVIARHPVHAALMLVMTLFGVALFFVMQRDDFLAAVQVIVYAGAVVVLFLFVIMFLGIDREENVGLEPLRGQRPLAIALGLLGLTGVVLLGALAHWAHGPASVAGPANAQGSNVALLGRSVFTTYLFPFEATAALLVIAVVGAVVLARRPPIEASALDAAAAGAEDGGGDGSDEPATYGSVDVPGSDEEIEA